MQLIYPCLEKHKINYILNSSVLWKKKLSHGQPVCVANKVNKMRCISLNGLYPLKLRLRHKLSVSLIIILAQGSR